jgi:hypothetical protein
VLTLSEGSFGADLWQGTDRRVVEALLPRLPVNTVSPTLFDLARRLLLTDAPLPPSLLAGQSVAPINLLQVRLERLAALGDLAGLNRLLDRLPTAQEPVLRQRLALENPAGRGRRGRGLPRSPRHRSLGRSRCLLDQGAAVLPDPRRRPGRRRARPCHPARQRDLRRPLLPAPVRGGARPAAPHPRRRGRHRPQAHPAAGVRADRQPRPAVAAQPGARGPAAHPPAAGARRQRPCWSTARRRPSGRSLRGACRPRCWPGSTSASPSRPSRSTTRWPRASRSTGSRRARSTSSRSRWAARPRCAPRWPSWRWIVPRPTGSTRPRRG